MALAAFITITVLFVAGVFATTPDENRNPHVDARRSWWTRNPK